MLCSAVVSASCEYTVYYNEDPGRPHVQSRSLMKGIHCNVLLAGNSTRLVDGMASCSVERCQLNSSLGEKNILFSLDFEFEVGYQAMVSF